MLSPLQLGHAGAPGGVPEESGIPLKAYGDPAKGGSLMHEHCRQNWLRERREHAP